MKSHHVTQIHSSRRSGVLEDLYLLLQPDATTGGVVAISETPSRVSFLRANGSSTGRAGFVATQPLVEAAISPDGRTLAGGGNNGTLELWNLSTGTLIASNLPVSQGDSSAAFLDGGRVVVSGDNDTISVVDLEPAALTTDRVSPAGRNLSQAEFRMYLGFEPTTGPVHNGRRAIRKSNAGHDKGNPMSPRSCPSLTQVKTHQFLRRRFLSARCGVRNDVNTNIERERSYSVVGLKALFL